MRISVISDDLTGASDCGGRLVRYGLEVSIVLESNAEGLRQKDVVIVDTDSRSVSEEEAYQRVRHVCEWVKNEPFDLVYKKIDSTMRGNIGQEINAVYDVFLPDFVIIAPAFPENGRQVIDGIHLLNGRQLHETEVAKDPKTPVNDSHIQRLIQNQAKREVGHLSHTDLHQGYECVVERLASFKERNISYVTVDSVHESDLEHLVQIMKKVGFSLIWVGSSGLMNYLPQAFELERKRIEVTLPKQEKPVLLVVGSVSAIGRVQLRRLLRDSDVTGIEVEATKVILDGPTKQQEVNRVIQESGIALQKGSHVALFSSNEVERTQQFGREHGYSAVQISNLISQVMGEIAVSLIDRFDLRHLFLTGGDTAHQVFHQMQVNEFHLIDEVEPGIPLGKIVKDKEIFVVTKAGNFGTDLAMVKAIPKLQGG
jgi:uncharacterized protein YgbK (DUF1537 family)